VDEEHFDAALAALVS